MQVRRRDPGIPDARKARPTVAVANVENAGAVGGHPIARRENDLAERRPGLPGCNINESPINGVDARTQGPGLEASRPARVETPVSPWDGMAVQSHGMPPAAPPHRGVAVEK